MKCRVIDCEHEITTDDFIIEIVMVGGEEKLDIQAMCPKCDDVVYTFVATDSFIGD